MSGAERKRKAPSVSNLVAIVDDYKVRTGQPFDASISRAIGVARQTVSSWRTRGLRDLPERDSLIALAKLVGLDYETVVLRAALVDAGWMDPVEPDETEGTDDAISS